MVGTAQGPSARQETPEAESRPAWLRAHHEAEAFKGLTGEQRWEVLKDLKRAERLVEMDRRGLLEAEQAWARSIARLYERDPDLPREERNHAIEFQRHAGRTARFAGWLEQAIEEYEEALDTTARVHEGTGDEPTSWYEATLRDIADTYLLMGAFDEAEALSRQIQEGIRSRGHRDSPVELGRLAAIAALQGRTDEAVELQELALRTEWLVHGDKFFKFIRDHHPDITGVDTSMTWPELVRHPGVRRVLDDPQYDCRHTSYLRDRYCQLAAAYRTSRQLEKAAHALETARITPWKPTGTYQPDHDLSLKREQAFLALALGEYDKALARADACLDRNKHAVTPPEDVELHDLASRALEGLGELQQALDRLQRAISIVEQRRARLSEDAHRQMYLATCAPLYRRACDLAIRRGLDCKATFRWSERTKARAMLDAMHQYDGQQAWDIALGRADDPAGAIPSIRRLQGASWWADDLALIEYSRLPGGIHAWLITKNTARRIRVGAPPHDVERQAAGLSNALQAGSNRDDRWVEPAAWLYDKLVRPLEGDLKGVTRLIVVWDNQLPQMPFETLICKRDAHEDRFIKHELLIERFVVSYAPSAALLSAICEREAPEEWELDFWGLATSRFHSNTPGLAENERDRRRTGARGPTLRDLRLAPQEVRGIAKDWFDPRRSRMLIDQPNSKASLLDAANGDKPLAVRFLHFATHAVADPAHGRRSGLYLCSPTSTPKASASAKNAGVPKPDTASATKEVPADTATRMEQPTASQHREAAARPHNLRPLPRPAVSGDDAALLTLREIADLNLRCELVTLSACGTLGGEPVPGDWFTGLTRAFLVGGSPEGISSGVVCTLWQVPDRTAQAATSALYRAMLMDDAKTPLNGAQALQRVKRAWLKAGSPRFAHPAAWSAYVYVGRFEPVSKKP